jgi:hypothetical protein
MLRFWPRVTASVTLLIGGLSCGEGNGGKGSPFMNRAPDSTRFTGRTIPTRGRPELTENSGAVMSSKQPGVLFTINDSGHEPTLFALDTSGSDRGAWRIGRASNGDWEAITSGPCTVNTDSVCLYIGDVGDNDARRRSVSIYQVPEPDAQQRGYTGGIRARRLRFRYEDGPHDVEAMFMAPDRAIALITKRRNVDAAGRPRPALIFSLPAARWTDTLAVARLTDSLPVDSGKTPLRSITDAALSPGGRFLAVRTYNQVVVFATDTLTARIRRDIRPAVCNVEPLKERQGEGVTWLSADGSLLLTSEGTKEPLRIVRCPLPK